MDTSRTRGTAEIQAGVEKLQMKDGFISDIEQSENTLKTGKHTPSTTIELEESAVNDLASSHSDSSHDDEPVTTSKPEKEIDVEKLSKATLERL